MEQTLNKAENHGNYFVSYIKKAVLVGLIYLVSEFALVAVVAMTTKSASLYEAISSVLWNITGVVLAFLLFKMILSSFRGHMTKTKRGSTP